MKAGTSFHFSMREETGLVTSAAALLKGDATASLFIMKVDPGPKVRYGRRSSTRTAPRGMVREQL